MTMLEGMYAVEETRAPTETEYMGRHLCPVLHALHIRGGTPLLSLQHGDSSRGEAPQRALES